VFFLQAFQLANVASNAVYFTPDGFLFA